ncbi:MAG: DegT/DnrJ/EryC1/StrS family aminotransferase [Candidatus Bathyarchaeota archaeon]|nr:DegT/DnrJ/EryC1/StrS family aminotransferase [Candidatus Bathyarchaeota archaeon]MDH5595100.1 DegT/DnrJ/EryC1/StrS family aminotransferase [Candidatus Bathyarchaeota archaeon]
MVDLEGMLNFVKAVQNAREARIPLAKPVFSKEMEKAAVDALLNERFVLGESVYKFEEEFARYCGVDYAVSTNSGTDALQIALTALGVTQGQKVVTSPASFIASSNVALHVGATPAFADIDLETYTIEPERVKRAISGKTRAVIPVHLYGYPADMDSINEIADEHGLYVVEDACQAHGALYKGRRAGSLGDVACFSFYPSKNMTVAGDGGMLVTDDEEVAGKAAKLRDCGRKGKYVHDLVGFTARLNTVNAAVGRVQLKHLDEWNEKRRKNAEIYDRLLSDLDELVLPPKGDGETRPVYHLYVIRTRRRDGLREWLESDGIECGVHYPLPIHLQPVYKKMFGFEEGTYPRSEELCKTCLSIPMYPDLTVSEIDFVSEKIHEFFETG